MHSTFIVELNLDIDADMSVDSMFLRMYLFIPVLLYMWRIEFGMTKLVNEPEALNAS